MRRFALSRPLRAGLLTLAVLVAGCHPSPNQKASGWSGLGRAGVLRLPRRPGAPGLVMEVKRIWTDEDETPEAALAEAHQQIEARGYRAELEAVGASPIYAIAVAFDGKQVWVR